MTIATVSYTGIAYSFFRTNSSDIVIAEDILNNNNGVLSFTFNQEIFTYDLSDSYNQEYDNYLFNLFSNDEDPENIYCDRIIFNTISNYITLFMSNGQGLAFNLSNPNELVDYR